jgi:hypothetical protein
MQAPDFGNLNDSARVGERLLVAYLSSVAGGPTPYAGREMKEAHRGLGITANDWEVFRAILGTRWRRSAFQTANVARSRPSPRA